MAECSCLPKCIFFNDKMAQKPATAELMKNKYCLGDNSACARYMVFKVKGSAGVPPDLFPSQIERVKELIA
jgi:hypothetical protein